MQFSLAVSLGHHPYFQNLAPQSLARLAAVAVPRAAGAGEVLFLEGDPSAGLWVLEQGQVKVYKLSAEGREHILHLIGPGESFNDIPALDGGPNAASAAALSEIAAWVIGSEVLREAIRRDPALAQAAIDALTARVRMLVQQIEDLALYPVQARLARFLLSRLEDPAAEHPGVTRAAIAAHLATTPETVSRMLRALEQAGAIRFDRHRIVIVNVPLLRALALE